jgi:hypothetical protein
VPALTAVQVIDKALTLQSDETLLVNGAGGATGGLIVALAVLRGARVLATAGPSSRDRASRAVPQTSSTTTTRTGGANPRGDGRTRGRCGRVAEVLGSHDGVCRGRECLKALRVELAAAFAYFAFERRPPPR